MSNSTTRSANARTTSSCCTRCVPATGCCRTGCSRTGCWCLNSPARATTLLAQHLAIHDAVRRGKPEAARKAAMDHITYVEQAMAKAELTGDWQRVSRLRLKQRTASVGAINMSDIQAPRRAVRDLPGRPVPAVRRLCRGQADRGCGLQRRGADGPDLLRPAGLQFRRPRRQRARSPKTPSPPSRVSTISSRPPAPAPAC